MRGLTCWTSLVVLAVLMCHLQMSAACSCVYRHPQTIYCDSEFVALVTVEEFATVTTSSYTVAYKVNVSQIFKAIPEARIAIEQKPLWVWTASQPSLCGVLSLKPGETWIIGGYVYGSQSYISYCGLALRWSDVTPFQRDNFREVYQHGCVCQISGGFSESPAKETCISGHSYEELSCQKRYGTCLLGANGCAWTPSADYDKCMMKHQLARQH